MNANEAYLLARAYTDKALEGAGALKGAPCQIKSITSITGGHRVTFEWEDSEGEASIETMDVMDGTNGTDGDDGVGISSITYKEEDQDGNYVYAVLLTDSSSYDITCPKGPQGSTGQTGATGNGIVSIEKTRTVGLVDTYTITYTNGTTSTFTVTNGQDGGSNEFIGTMAEWNALSPAQQKAFDTYQITDDYSEALLPNYSTVEQKTGQKWIDGKDIYVITKANVAPETVIATNVDKVINCVIARHGGGADSSQIKFVGDGFIQPDGGGINLESGSASYVTWSGSGNVLDRTADHIVLYYTKTA